MVIMIVTAALALRQAKDKARTHVCNNYTIEIRRDGFRKIFNVI
jgi:hypothetical protein